VSSAGTVTRGDFRPREAGLPRRLVLLSESAGLAAVLTCLLDPRDRLTRSAWTDDAAGDRHLADADLVVLDVPRDARAAAFAQVRRRYRGPVVVLVDRGDKGRGLPPDPGRTLLARPFSTDDLRAALNLGPAEPPAQAAPTRPAPPTPAPSRPAPATPAVRRPPAPAGPGPWPAVPEPRAAGREPRRGGGPDPRPGAPATAAGAASAAAGGAATAPAVGAGVAPAALAGKAASMVAPPAGSAEVASLFAAPGERAYPGQSGILSVDGKAAARVAPPRPGAPAAEPSGRRGRLAVLLAGLVHGWRGRRAVRVAGFSGLAAVAFFGAFALAAQGRCGPGCDDLKPIAPVTTLPAVDTPLAPTTTPRRRPPSTTTATPGDGYRGAPAGVAGSTTSTTRRATTTTRASSGTTRPTSPVTKPPTTPPPPTPTPTPTTPPPTPTPTPPPPST
jgi:hypothetical protein